MHDRGGYKPEDILEKPYQKLIEETNKVFDYAITDNEIPPEMLAKLQSDTFVFSGLRTHSQLLEASSFLLDKEGKIRGFDSFAQDFNKVNEKYNQNYLEAEYQFAVNSSQMAANWSALDPDGRYNLQYRTANDSKVRADHQALNNTTLPVNDSFWMLYYPPNGWRCRCTAVEVRKSKYPESDSKKAMAAGEKATSQIGKDGKNKLEIFRFNPGAENKVFPPKHPYNKVKGANDVKDIIVKKLENSIDISSMVKGELPTNKEVKNILTEFANKFPENFRSGLDKVLIAKSTSYLMQHGMSYRPSTGEWVNGSTISLSSHTFSAIDFNPLDELKGAFGSLKKKSDLTFKQEYALESLWHEILHAKTNTKPASLSELQNKNMETVNEFVARHTYDKFIEQLGGKASNKKEILEKGYGYSSWIISFRKRLADANISEDKAVEFLEPHLMEKYSTLGTRISEFFETNKKQ